MPTASSPGSSSSRSAGPGQGDRYLDFSRAKATLEQMKWVFSCRRSPAKPVLKDLLAMTQVKMPVQAKLEMARKLLGRNGPAARTRACTARCWSGWRNHFALSHHAAKASSQKSLALGNRDGRASRATRRYAFHSVGALGVIEMTAPTRAGFVDRGLRPSRRAGPRSGHYFAVHAVARRQSIRSLESRGAAFRWLPKMQGARARSREGAVIRLWHGAETFARYRGRIRPGRSAQQGRLDRTAAAPDRTCGFSASAIIAILSCALPAPARPRDTESRSISAARCRTAPLAGLVTRVDDWQAELGWIRAVGDNGIVLFEKHRKKSRAVAGRLAPERLSRHRRQRPMATASKRRAFAQECSAPKPGFRSVPCMSLRTGRRPSRSWRNIRAVNVVKFNGPLESFVGPVERRPRTCGAFLAGLFAEPVPRPTTSS